MGNRPDAHRRSRARARALVATALLVAAVGTLPAHAADPSPAPKPEPTGSEPARTTVQEHSEDAAALARATEELAQTMADLALARQTLDRMRGQLRQARSADRNAQRDLEVAVLAEQRTARELAAVEARIRGRQASLGRLARRAYQTNGSMGEWAVVLSAATPNELADRIAFLQSVGSAGNAVLADLAQDQADLVNTQVRMTAARELATTARAAAASTLTAVRATERLASAAERQVRSVLAARQAAYEAARKAAVEDRRRYRVLVVQSGALGSRIVDLARQLAEAESSPKSTGTFVLPGTGEVTSPYGPRLHPILRYVKVHTGTDISAGDGIVYAADDGVVLFTEYNIAYGNMTVIDHGKVGGQRVSTLYAHQAAAGVKTGDRVRKGQAIGVVGSTGYSTGPHLHFEVRVDGVPLDPAPFLVQAKLPDSVGKLPTP